MTSRGSHIHKPMVKFLKMLVIFLQISQNIDGFRQHKAFRIHKTLFNHQNTLEESLFISTKTQRIIFYFHYLPKLYIGFNNEGIVFLDRES